VHVDLVDLYKEWLRLIATITTEIIA
jgi:hypothetical protein